MHPSTQLFVDAARRLNLEIEVLSFEQTTRTAEEAAAAIGCNVAQIVKSLFFVAGGQPVMVLVSGANQLDTRKLAKLRHIGGKQVKRGDAETVKSVTGFSIGGVPPFGYKESLPVYVDEDLLRFETVWAAAGTPHTVFAIAPSDLLSSSRGQVATLRR